MTGRVGEDESRKAEIARPDDNDDDCIDDDNNDDDDNDDDDNDDDNNNNNDDDDDNDDDDENSNLPVYVLCRDNQHLSLVLRTKCEPFADQAFAFTGPRV